jgi:hypothetical protein
LFQDDGPIWPTIDALNSVFEIRMPYDRSTLEHRAKEFAKFSHGVMENCVLAVDGWVCRTRAPYKKEVDDVKSFFNRHGCFALVVMAGCDANCRFDMFSCNSAGSTPDVTAWSISKLKQQMDAKLLPIDFYFVGDEAFVNADQFLVPWSGHGLREAEDAFNFHLSSMRQCIERAFGITVSRWGIFWRPFKFKMTMWSTVARVCAKLHNFCIDMKESVPRRPAPTDRVPADATRLLFNENEIEAGTVLDHREFNRRKEITESIRTFAYVRPTSHHSRVASRFTMAEDLVPPQLMEPEGDDDAAV